MLFDKSIVEIFDLKTKEKQGRLKCEGPSMTSIATLDKEGIVVGNKLGYLYFFKKDHLE